MLAHMKQCGNNLHREPPNYGVNVNASSMMARARLRQPSGTIEEKPWLVPRSYFDPILDAAWAEVVALLNGLTFTESLGYKRLFVDKYLEPYV
jgi:hypothetical protein